MERNRGRAAIRVTVLTVGSTLANLGKSQTLQDPGDLARPQDREVAHAKRP